MGLRRIYDLSKPNLCLASNEMFAESVQYFTMSL